MNVIEHKTEWKADNKEKNTNDMTYETKSHVCKYSMNVI